MATGIGARRWVIPEGYIPGWSHATRPEMVSHESLSILNAGDRDASVEIRVFYADREPGGPYRLVVAARRTRHVRLDELTEPEPIPRATEYSTLVSADAPVVVQYTRLDSRQAENALLSTIAFPVPD